MKTFSINTLTRKNVLEMKSYASARDEFQDFSEKMIFLDANENPFDTGLNRYPDPKQKQLKKLFSKIKSVPESNIIFGNGSDELLDLVFRAFCEPNRDAVITLPPTYGMYGVLANLNAIENREILLDSNFEPDTKEILNAVDANTKIIFLCSPNNPTGNSFSEENISEILNNFNGLVLIDEAYIDFSSKESWLQKISDYPNLIVLQTVSKAIGLAGIRLGILYANAPIIAILDKIKPPYNVNELTQQKAFDTVSDLERIKSDVGKIIYGRNFLQNEFAKINFIKRIYPTDANFILIKVDDSEKRYAQLIEKKVVVRNRSNQPGCENCLRITVGTDEENTKLIQILNEL